MKYLVVNADDFGTSRGVNRGIVEAHETGILTSASLMADSRASAEAARLAARHPALGVGLHVVLPADSTTPVDEVERQLEHFIELTGQAPTHLDSHHNVHREHDLLPVFLEVAERHALPLRGHCGVRHISSFYGQSGGHTDLDQVSPAALAQILATEVEDGFNELCCHPGYADRDLESSYSFERQRELETLCDPEVAALLGERKIELVTFREVAPG